jgi:hypothetical protein
MEHVYSIERCSDDQAVQMVFVQRDDRHEEEEKQSLVGDGPPGLGGPKFVRLGFFLLIPFLSETVSSFHC